MNSDAACPYLFDYDDALLERAAAEIEALPEDAALARMMADYAAVREQTRSCVARLSGS